MSDQQRPVSYLDRQPTMELVPRQSEDRLSSGANQDTAGGVLPDSSRDAPTYLRLPADPTRAADRLGGEAWRIGLFSDDIRHEPLHLEICGDVFIGRAATGFNPDLDLTSFGAGDLGVSRQHALLRPTATHLYIADLGSPNGTFCNNQRLTAGAGYELEDNNTIAFGGLRFSIKFIGKQ